jgi:predicted flap endonuclease-1-like 5' DNA nuclease
MDRQRFKEILSCLTTILGIGESTKRVLNCRGIFTVEDLANTDTKFLGVFEARDTLDHGSRQ